MKIPPATQRVQKIIQELTPLEKAINVELMEWDPIGVGQMEGMEHNLWEEYIRYLPELKQALENRKPIKPVLDWIEGEAIGYFYTSEERRLEVATQIEMLAALP